MSDSHSSDNEPFIVRSWLLWLLLYGIPLCLFAFIACGFIQEYIKPDFDYPRSGTIVISSFAYPLVKTLSKSKKRWRIGWMSLCLFYGLIILVGIISANM